MTRTVVSCRAPYGSGGLGQHLAAVVDELRSSDELECYYSTAPRAGDERGRRIVTPGIDRLARCTPLRILPSARVRVETALFDRAVAARLRRGVALHGFSLHCLRSLRRAAAAGAGHLALESPTAHLSHVERQLRRAELLCGVERTWCSPALRRVALAEYSLADVIHVASTYARDAFIAHGIRPERLRLRRLEADPRFRPSPAPRRHDRFVAVYAGALTTAKGVPVLVDAFRRLEARDAELRLVGGWTTRGMRRHLERCMARDPRIQAVPGDPLPHLQAADVYVHPSFQDGLGYAPLEALACGVPVIVTDETGMQDRVVEGVNGFVVPAGDWRPIHALLTELASRRLAVPAPSYHGRDASGGG